MCHKSTMLFTVCAHSQKLPTIKCEKSRSFMSKMKMDRCVVTRQAELICTWCAECEAIFKANGVNSTVVNDFDPRTAAFITRYWAFKSREGWIGPVGANIFPQYLVESKDEIAYSPLLDGSVYLNYENYALQREIDEYGATSVCIEKRHECTATNRSECHAIIQLARRLTIERGMLGGEDDPAFPRNGKVANSSMDTLIREILGQQTPEWVDSEGNAPEWVDSEGNARGWDDSEGKAPEWDPKGKAPEWDPKGKAPERDPKGKAPERYPGQW
ncbi:hypothetical protein ACHAPT_000800 [Fusarium lateritium]